MDTLAARVAQRVTQRAAVAPTKPYENTAAPFYQFSATVDFASTAAGAASTAVDVPVPAGMTLTDGNTVLVSPVAAMADGVQIIGKVKAGGANVRLQLVNNSGSTVDAASAQLQVRVAK